MKIGIFDSGVGGLSIAKKIDDHLPGNEIFYVADSEYAPYGELDGAKIYERSLHCVEMLIKKQVEVIVIACNTATAASVKLLRERFDVPFIGVEPDLHFKAREKISIQGHQKICVLCTSHTFDSEKFIELRRLRDSKNELEYVPMKELAYLIEKSFWSIKGAEVNREECIEKSEEMILSHIKANVPLRNCAYLVLGCTHYELLRRVIENGLKIKTVGVSDGVLNRLIELFNLRDFCHELSCADSCAFWWYYQEENKWQKTNLNELLSWPNM